ncbi:DgyrCDS9866 [Dimorphilus gyrociliatus]|uniref:DgyrCDS9866 n=1 Tax=Dimorphilus gyrociliatus TaxID=2664684 RepID=A0A7I8VZK6_9ANNE|nr:DgyrCDS9866 [Dimorphilus gyrociliatus]
MATGDSQTKPQNYTDEERNELIDQINKDFDEFLEKKLATSKGNSALEDKPIEELLAELDRHPAFMKEIKPSDVDNEYVQALMSLKYETEDTRENAESYKEEGNRHFKLKKYKWAIDNYTAGIEEKCPDKDLNAILYSNRAAANYHRGNYGSALRDASLARKFKKDHMKAVIKGAECCIKLSRFDDAMEWCKYGLLLDESQEKIQKLNEEAKTKLIEKNKKERKAIAERKRLLRKKTDLMSAIKTRGIRLTMDGNVVDLSNEEQIEKVDLENCHSGVSVYLSEDGSMVWPVMFLYPEYGQTDFIQEFQEADSFADHLKVIFAKDCEPPPWDTEFKYKYNNLEIFFENKDERKLYKIRPSMKLLEALKMKKFFVEDGTPAFILLPKNSSFSEDFLKKYKFET